MARKQVKRFEVSHVHVGSVSEAWQVAGSYFPGDYEKDDRASACAGYPIYRSPSDWALYVCDLCTRLEVNLSNGDTVNVWIDDDDPVAAAPAAVADGDGLQGSGVNSAEGSAAAGDTPAEGSPVAGADSVQGSENGAGAIGSDAPAVLAATDPRPACWVISDGLEGDERVQVDMVSRKDGFIRSFDTLAGFLREWSWFYSCGVGVMDDDKLAAALQYVTEAGHGARASVLDAGFDIVFTFYRWRGYDRFMNRIHDGEVVA